MSVLTMTQPSSHPLPPPSQPCTARCATQDQPGQRGEALVEEEEEGEGEEDGDPTPLPLLKVRLPNPCTATYYMSAGERACVVCVSA